jgi:hypothetical protein
MEPDWELNYLLEEKSVQCCSLTAMFCKKRGIKKSNSPPFLFFISVTKQNKKNSVALSPQANYTD